MFGEVGFPHMTALKDSSLWLLSLTQKLTLNRFSQSCWAGSGSRPPAGSCPGPSAPTTSVTEICTQWRLVLSSVATLFLPKVIQLWALQCFLRNKHPNVDAALRLRQHMILESVSRRLKCVTLRGY